MSWPVFLTIFHILGTVLGLGGSIFAEIFVIKSLRNDKTIDPVEGSFLKIIYLTIRIGMVLLLLSGVGYLLYFRIEGPERLLYNERFWAKMVLTVAIVVNALLIQTRKLPLWLGSAVALTSWSAAMILGIWRGLDASFFGIMVAVVISTVIVAFILEGIKKPILSQPK